MVKRVQIYFPKFEGAVEGYVKNFLKKNLWRVAATMEFEDAMQEAYLLFLILKEKYGPTDTPQHFMSLYKSSWTRRFNDLSTVDFRHRDKLVELTEEEEAYRKEHVIGDADTYGYLTALMGKAPEELRLIFSLILSTSSPILNQAVRNWEAQRGTESYLEMLATFAGLPVSYNAEKEVLNFILH